MTGGQVVIERRSRVVGVREQEAEPLHHRGVGFDDRHPSATLTARSHRLGEQAEHPHVGQRKAVANDQPASGACECSPAARQTSCQTL